MERKTFQNNLENKQFEDSITLEDPPFKVKEIEICSRVAFSLNLGFGSYTRSHVLTIKARIFVKVFC